MAKRAKKKARKQKIAEDRRTEEKTPPELIDAINSMPDKTEK